MLISNHHICIMSIGFAVLSLPDVSINLEVGCGVVPLHLMQWCTSEDTPMIMTDGRKKEQRAGPMLTACRTSRSHRHMSWVSTSLIFLVCYFTLYAHLSFSPPLLSSPLLSSPLLSSLLSFCLNMQGVKPSVSRS